MSQHPIRTRVEVVGPRNILIQAEVMGGPAFSAEREAAVCAAISEAVETALERFQPNEENEHA